MIGGDALAQLPTRAITELYRPMRTGSWELTITPLVICPGYWGPPQPVANMAALQRNSDVWMSLTPLEFESQAIGIAAATGHVVIFGLGMGWAAAECALDPDVTAVTVVERDPDVIALHRELALFDHLPDGCHAKVAIVEGDALLWRPDLPVDLLMPDIWLPLVSATDRAAEVRQMQANVQARAVYFWGQELEIARQAAARGLAQDSAGITAVVGDMALPLVGPDTLDYPERVRAAAKAWMRGRWLPGTENPLA